MAKNIGEKIKHERERLGWTQGHLAGKLGLTVGTISGYERNYRTPDLETINKIAAELGCSVDYLVGRTDTRYPYKKQFDLLDALEDKGCELTAGASPITQQQRINILSVLDNHALPPKDKQTNIPLLGTIRAGIPLLSEQNIIGHIDIPADLVGKADFALNVRGDSMIGAGINEGDVAVCKENKEGLPGQIVVALVNNDETTLKYYIRDNGNVVLRAANPEFKDIEFKHGDIIQGHVVKILKDPPPVNLYRDYIYFREGHLQEWNEVIEKAVASGIKPFVMKGLIEAQVEIAKRLAKEVNLK